MGNEKCAWVGNKEKGFPFCTVIVPTAADLLLINTREFGPST